MQLNPARGRKLPHEWYVYRTGKVVMVYAAQPREGTETLLGAAVRLVDGLTVYAAQPREGTETIL